MNAKKVVALLLFVAGITLVILGGVYNPYTDVINLPQGTFRGIGFTMRQGEVSTYHISSVDVFTVYIMNSTEFHKLMNHGTFNGSYYTNTGRSMNLEFKAPKGGVYYIIIANFNSQGNIEVDFSYKKGIDLPLIIIGSGVVAFSLLILSWEIMKSKKGEKLDMICPECGNRVSRKWNYCPYCRHDLRGDKK